LLRLTSGSDDEGARIPAEVLGRAIQRFGAGSDIGEAQPNRTQKEPRLPELKKIAA
jgi:hypothetical protein